MEKVWYILIDQKEEGPYSVKELLRDSRITLNTLVWREGFANWVPLRRVKELRAAFGCEVESEKEKKTEKSKNLGFRDIIALDYSPDPNFFYLFILIVICLILYLIYQTY